MSIDGWKTLNLVISSNFPSHKKWGLDFLSSQKLQVKFWLGKEVAFPFQWSILCERINLIKKVLFFSCSFFFLHFSTYFFFLGFHVCFHWKLAEFLNKVFIFFLLLSFFNSHHPHYFDQKDSFLSRWEASFISFVTKSIKFFPVFPKFFPKMWSNFFLPFFTLFCWNFIQQSHKQRDH